MGSENDEPEVCGETQVSPPSEDRTPSIPGLDIYEQRIELKQKLEERAVKAEEKLASEEKMRKELEEKNLKMIQEKNDLASKLEQEKDAMGDYGERLTKVNSQKADLESQLTVRRINFFNERPE